MEQIENHAQVLSTICRLCVKVIEQGTMSPIFQNENYKETSISERIKSCISLEVSEDDGLPSHICQKCLCKLNQSYVFRNQCVLADSTLRGIIKNFSNSSLENLIQSLDIVHDVSKCNTSGFSSTDAENNEVCAEETSHVNGETENTVSDDFLISKTKLENEKSEDMRFYDKKTYCDEIQIDPVESTIKGDERKIVMKKTRFISRSLLKKYKTKSEFRQSYRGRKLKRNELSTLYSNPNEGNRKFLKVQSSGGLKTTIKIKRYKVDDIERPMTNNKSVLEADEIKKEKSENIEEVSVEPDVYGFGNHRGIKKEFLKEENETDSEYWERVKVLRSKGKGAQKQRGRPRKYPTPREKPPFFTCEYCQKVYPSEGGWRYHIHTVHNENYQPFICDLCGKSFKVKKNLEGHKNSIHFHLKQHLCDLCGRGFASKYALKVHKIWHSDEKNFPCDICGTKFRTRGKMNTHRTIHGGPKKFMCEVCSRNFRWKKDFEIHMRTHTGEKPYKCSHCGKAFSSLTNMKKHERNHTTEHTAFLQRNVTVEGERDFKINLPLPVVQIVDDRVYKNDVCNTNFSFGYPVDDVRNRNLQ